MLASRSQIRKGVLCHLAGNTTLQCYKTALCICPQAVFTLHIITGMCVMMFDSDLALALHSGTRQFFNSLNQRGSLLSAVKKFGIEIFLVDCFCQHIKLYGIRLKRQNFEA